MREVVRAAAVELGDRVEVISNARGRARRFDFSVQHWQVQGPERAIAIGARVERELRRLGVRSDTVSVRIAG